MIAFKVILAGVGHCWSVAPIFYHIFIIPGYVLPSKAIIELGFASTAPTPLPAGRYYVSVRGAWEVWEAMLSWDDD